MNQKTRNGMVLLVVALVFMLPSVCGAADKNPKLANVSSIYVATTNIIADIVREQMLAGITCLRLAKEEQNATAILDIGWDLDFTKPLSGTRVRLIARVTGQLSNPIGDLIWQHTASSTSGKLVAVRKLLYRLAREIGCADVQQLENVTAILVQGRGRAATRIRQKLRKGKTCLELVETRDQADATLYITQGELGRIAFGTVTLRASGDVIWNRKANSANTKLTADRLLGFLTKDCKCKQRKKRRK